MSKQRRFTKEFEAEAVRLAGADGRRLFRRAAPFDEDKPLLRLFAVLDYELPHGGGTLAGDPRRHPRCAADACLPPAPLQASRPDADRSYGGGMIFWDAPRSGSAFASKAAARTRRAIPRP